MNEESEAVREYVFTFSITEINHIITGLQEIPTKYAVPIINKIHLEYNNQLNTEK
jgi:hypothetical protein